MWEKHVEAFLTLDEVYWGSKCGYKIRSYLVSLLKSWNINGAVWIPLFHYIPCFKPFSLHLKCYSNQIGVWKFLSEMKSNLIAYFPPTKKLQISPIKELPVHSRDDLSFFLTATNFTSLKHLSLHGGDIEVNRFLTGLKKVVSKVSGQVFLKELMMKKTHFWEVILSAKNAQELWFVYWSIYDSDQEIEIDSADEFKLKTLKLYGTLYKSDKPLFNQTVLEDFFETIKQTAIKNTLKEFHVLGKWCPITNLKKLVSRHLNETVVIDSKEEPSELS
jgi:hypothetical protein